MNSTPLNTRIALGFRFLGLGLLLLNPVMSSGFDNRTTHRDLTRVSIRASGLDQFLKTTLRLDQGVNAPLSGTGMSQAISGWLEDGSQREDEPDCRASNHFHNPLKPFAEAGVTDQDGVGLWCWATTEYKPAYSSVTWGTGYTAPQTQGSGTTRNQQFDWKAARVAYVNALKASAPSDREAALAQTFLTLGYILHLVQDLAVPAHVRDDFQSHLADCRVDPNQPLTSWCGNSLEIYLRDNGAVVQDILTRIAPATIGFQEAYITRFWDTDQYTGTNPSADTAQGLAEYVNGNFASPNTIFTEGKLPGERYRFLRPAQASTNLAAVQAKSVDALKPCLAPDGRTDKGWYVTKYTHGEVVPYFAKGSYLYHNAVQTYPPPPQELLFQLDQCVHRSYAERLLPRAVGYSAGLLDYFFRGKLDFQVTLEKDETAVTTENPRPPYRFALVIQNGGNDPMIGDFFLYADTGDSDAPDSWRRELVVAKNLVLSRAGEGGQTYPMPPQIPFFFTPPANLKRLILVFKGTLGVETDYAVAAKVKAWQMPVAFAVQESTELLGDTVREEILLAYPNKEIRLYNAAGRQRVTGTFAVRGAALTGKDIQRISIEGNWGGSLRIDGMPSGSVWVRGNADAPDPVRWEIVTEFDSSTYSWGAGDARAYLPTTVTVETVAGFTTKTPLVLWLWAQSSGRRWCLGGGNFSGYEHCTYVRGVVFYGDGDHLGYDPITTHLNYPSLNRRIPITTPDTFVGFVPVGVGGNPVGVTEDTSGDEVFDDERFAWRSDGDRYWDKNRFKFYLHKGLDDTIAAPEPEPISPPPTAQVKRFYFPEELTAFGRLGVQPPDNDAVITLQ